MHGTLTIGVAHRQLVVADLNIPDVGDLGPHGLHAANPQLGLAQVSPAGNPSTSGQVSTASNPSANGLEAADASVAPLVVFWGAPHIAMPAFQPAAISRDQFFSLGNQPWLVEHSAHLSRMPALVLSDSTYSSGDVQSNAKLLDGFWLLDNAAAGDDSVEWDGFWKSLGNDPVSTLASAPNAPTQTAPGSQNSAQPPEGDANHDADGGTDRNGDGAECSYARLLTDSWWFEYGPARDGASNQAASDQYFADCYCGSPDGGVSNDEAQSGD
jgi:hypothetical protein